MDKAHNDNATGASVSRRTMLQTSAMALASAALLACTSSRPSETPASGLSSVAPATPARPFETGDIVGREMCGNPTDRGATICVVPGKVTDLMVEYGDRTGAYTARSQFQGIQASLPVQLALSGLKPNTRYYYRVRSSEKASDERSFVTQRPAGTPFVFAIQGDSHPERLKRQFDPDLYQRCLETVRADQPDFYIAIGDDFSVDTLRTVNKETVREVYLSQRRFLSALDCPVFLVNGNHEQASMANLDGTPNNVAVWAQNHRNSYFAQPAPDGFYTGSDEQVQHIGLLRDYYAFTWGDALFAVIDPYWHSKVTVDNEFEAGNNARKNRDLWDITIGNTQYQWLKRTLETSTARHKFVISHHVLGTGRGGVEVARAYEWGDTAQLKTRRPGWEKTIHGLMAANNVAIFFQGHDHIYVRQELDGVIYQTLPEPADPNYSWFNEDAYRSGTKLPNSGYLRVKVSPEAVNVEYVLSVLPKDENANRKHGQVAHSYTVAARPGRA